MRNEWKWYVYILRCQDKSYYVGCTWNTAGRVSQHVSELGGRYTREHGVDKLMYSEEFDDLEVARNREKQIKGWTREKKEKLISGEWSKEW